MKTNIPRKITNGMWVVSVINSTRRVGIITDIAPPHLDEKGTPVPALCRLNLVNEEGLTTARIPNEPLDGLVQAKYDEIPAPRRELSREAFAKLGYV